MKTYKSIIRVCLTLFLLLSSARPLFAAHNAAPEALPPLPQWPIIGPVLRWLGAAEEAPPAIETPLRDLPEYSLESLDDIKALNDLKTNESVRLIATDDTLNAVAEEAIADIDGLNAATITFAQDLANGYAQIDRTILDKTNIDFPLGGQSLEISAEVGLSASACHVTVELNKLKVNRLGVAWLFRGQIDQIILENWPEEICIEDIRIKPGEIIIEGYHR